jgi:hypothetical protein
MEDGGAGALHDAPVGDAGGADRLAVAALEAQIQVTDHGRRRLYHVFGERAHEVQAAAGTLGLEARLDVRRAMLEAEPAADTLREVHLGRGEP